MAAETKSPTERAHAPKSVRRRITLDRLSEKILFVLHEACFDEKRTWLAFADIRSNLSAEPANPIRLELELLVRGDLVTQDSDVRFKPNVGAIYGGLAQPETRYEVDADRYKISKSGILKIEKLGDEEYELLATAVGIKPPRSAQASAAQVDDEWEPLPIDRNSPQAIEAIEKSEWALREIEQSNGYAAKDPDERNGIVETIRGTLAALKTGLPSRQAIVAGLLAPFKFIGKKFSDATIGEAAKAAAAAIVKWLMP